MDWVCSSCGRHFNWSVSECPHCRFQTTVTTSGTQPTSDNNERNAIAAFEQWAHLFEVSNPNRGPIHFGEKQAFLAGYSAATASVS